MGFVSSFYIGSKETHDITIQKNYTSFVLSRIFLNLIISAGLLFLYFILRKVFKKGNEKSTTILLYNGLILITLSIIFGIVLA